MNVDCLVGQMPTPAFRAPASIAETGLSESMLEDLIARAMKETGVTTLAGLASRIRLTSAVIEKILGQFKSDGRLEVKAASSTSSGLRFALTDAGLTFAAQAYGRSGYVGPAPVPIEQYSNAVQFQSLSTHGINREDLAIELSDVVLNPATRDQLGAAMHSGKAIFIYGPPGTGKTYICGKIASLLGTPVRIPYAVSAGDSIVRVFDPLLHRPIDRDLAYTNELLIARKSDERFVLCHRPFITSGGELSADMLEIQYDADSRQYHAPLQMKALNGMYLIDDLGRQRIGTTELFNRWIVPMESRFDYLSMQSGDRMAIPFDLMLIFSTNLDPKDIADAAFLRRIGHKIPMGYLTRDEYTRIWQSVCESLEVSCEQSVLDYVVDEMHAQRDQPMVACNPRDLVGLACNFLDYENRQRVLDTDVLEKAWLSNFVRYE